MPEIEIIQWRKHGDDEDSLSTFCHTGTAKDFDANAFIRNNYEIPAREDEDEGEGTIYETNTIVLKDGDIVTGENGVALRVHIEPVDAGKYSVLLLYPDYASGPEGFGRSTYFEHTVASSPQEAVTKVQKMAQKANKKTVEDHNDFLVLAVFAGHIEMELGAADV